MKYIIFVSLLLVSFLSRSQWTTGSGLIYYNGGNVGIGTTSPRGLFDVAGNGDIYLSNSPNTGTSQSLFLPGDVFIAPYNGGNVSYLQARRQDNSGSTQLQIRTYNSGSLVDAMLINSNGDVGIGTASPSVKLEVAGEIKQTGRTTYLWGAGSNENQALMFAGWGAAHGGIYWRGDSHTFTINTGNNADNAGNYGNANLAVTGNVLIGTTSLPSVDAKLAVDGNIYSRKVKVTQSGWADYVFHPTYRLRPLSEVEQYIQQYQHLPEVPSAAEVEKDGIDLGDNQATLLKKIEELTLYLIEQNKKLEALEKEMQQLRKAKDVSGN